MMLRLASIAVTAGVLALSISSSARPVALEAARPLGAERYELRGDFGAQCNACEVVVAYSDGLRYAHRIEVWTPRRIVARIADLNRGVDVRVSVRTAAGTTEPLRLRLLPVIVPQREFTTPVPADVLQKHGFFERNHQLAVGDKGEDVFDLSAALPPSCGRQTRIFDHASVAYKNQRFGQAQIVALPPKGCVRCPPLKVRWYHEPTGRLTYQLHVYRRVIEGVCPDRVR